MVFINRHISNLRLDLSICRLYSALVSIEVFYAAAPANWVSAADTLKVPSEPCGVPTAHAKCLLLIPSLLGLQHKNSPMQSKAYRLRDPA